MLVEPLGNRSHTCGQAKPLQMPLHFLSNKDTDWFILDKENGTFSIKPELTPWWNGPFFRDLTADRVRFPLTPYFFRKVQVADIICHIQGRLPHPPRLRPRLLRRKPLEAGGHPKSQTENQRQKI